MSDLDLIVWIIALTIMGIGNLMSGGGMEFR